MATHHPFIQIFYAETQFLTQRWVTANTSTHIPEHIESCSNKTLFAIFFLYLQIKILYILSSIDRVNCMYSTATFRALIFVGKKKETFIFHFDFFVFLCFAHINYPVDFRCLSVCYYLRIVDTFPSHESQTVDVEFLLCMARALMPFICLAQILT